MSDAPNPFDEFDVKGSPVSAEPSNPFDSFDERGHPKPPTIMQALGASFSGEPETPEGRPLAGPIWDTIAEKGPISGILDAFGQGAKDQWGATVYGPGPLGLSPETVESMRKNGYFNDYESGNTSLAKTFNEAFIRGGAQALEGTFRLASGAIAAIGGGIHNVAVEYAPPLAAGMEAFPTGLPGGAGALGAPGAFRAAIPASIAEARSLGVIGPGGEAAWKGSVEQAALDTDAMREAVARLTPTGEPIARQVSREPFGPPEQYGPPAELAGDVHAAARQIAPEVFSEYDSLADRKATFNEWLGDLSEQRDRGTTPEISTLDRQIDAMREQALTVTPTDRRPLNNQITELENQRTQLVQSLPTAGDTSGMAMIRRDLMATDERMRDLAPQVSAAYRQAADTGSPTTPETALAGAAEESALGTHIGSTNSPDEIKQAVANLPPVPDGYARMFHGGVVSPQEGVGRWLAHDPVYAAHYREGGKLYYIDLPETSSLLKETYDRTGMPGAKPSYAHAEAPEEIAKGLRPVTAAPPAPETPPVEAMTPEVPTVQPKPSINGSISGDVARQLVAAGRPQEEAAAVGALQEARYQARATNLTGTTPEQLYAEEAPTIAAGRGTSPRRLGRTVVDEDKTTIQLMAHADASTAVHELGHSYLEELSRDAADARATDGVRADAKTVRDWLGNDVSEPLPARDHPDFKAAEKGQRLAHEKFARGFERYMMEGHAPSESLAGVFDKFKNWLTNIYQTVARLRSPINADIRAVFDRMLAAPEGKPIIAAEREPTGTFASLHETDATQTPPPEAASMARLVRNERDRIGEAAAPEIENERTNSRATAETSGGAGGGGLPREEIAGAGPAAGPAGGVSESSAVGAGGSQAAAESARLPEQSTGRSGDGGAASNASGNLAPADRGLIDKAGNIRLDKLNTSEDVANAIRDMAAEHGDFVSARRGVVSDAQVLALANDMGLRPGDLDVARLRSEFSPERIHATRQLFVDTANETHRLSLVDNPTDADVAAYMTARSRLRMVQEYLSAITAESGRGTRAFRTVISGMESARNIATITADLAEERTFFQMRAEMRRVSRFDQTRQVQGYLRDIDRPGLGAMAEELFKNWLISGPITHMGYLVGNETFALWKAIPEALAQGAIGSVQRALGVAGSEASPRIGEVSAAYALLYGQKRGIKAAWDSLKAGQTMPLPGEAAAAAAGGNPIVTPFTGRQAIPNFVVGGVPIPLGSAIRAPGERMIAPIHSYTRTLGYEHSIARQAYRGAAAEGLTGDRFNARLAYLTAKPSVEMMKIASDEATEAALMGKGGSLTQRVSHLTNLTVDIPGLGPTRPLAFINPFMKVASNMMSQTVLERGIGTGPAAALFPGRIRDDILGKNGPVAQAETGGRLLAGTSLTMVGAGLAMEGLIARSAPSDPRERAMWTLIHGMPHSLNIGGMSYDLSRLGVLGFGLGIAADIQYAASRIGVDDAAKILSLAVHSFSQNFLDESFMRGPSDLIKALDEPDRYGAAYARNLFSSFAVPYSVGMGQIAHEIDPYMRQARTLTDEVIAKIPWWSETLEPRIDIWGNPVLARGWALTYHQQLQNDPVNQAMTRLGYFPAPVERKIVGVALSDHQYTEFSIMAGRWAHDRVAHVVASLGFDLQNEGDQREALRHQVMNARKDAEDHMKFKYPAIWQAASAAKKAPLRGTKPPAGGWPQTVH